MTPEFTELPANIYNDPFLLRGKRVVVVSTFVPKMQLSADVPVTDEFRAEINEWMIEFFGKKYLLPDDSIIMGEEAFYMNPNAYAVFQQKMSPFMEVRRDR